MSAQQTNDEKIAHVNQQIGMSQTKVQLGDQLFNQFLFDKAKQPYTEAAQILLGLMKQTKDDAQFQQYLKQQLTYALSRAEKCKENVSS